MKNWIVFLLEIILLYFVLKILIKKYINCSQSDIDKGFIGTIVLCFLPFFCLHALHTYNIEGNLRYIGFDYYDDCIYQTVDNEEYYLQNGRLTNVENNDIVYYFEQAYLDRNGNLVIDTNGEYRQTSYLGVYVNSDKHRVYRIDYCRWGTFGGISLPEGPGIYCNQSYYKLIRFDMFNFIQDFYNKDAQEFSALIFLGFCVFLIISTFLILFELLKKLIKSEYKIGQKIKLENSKLIDKILLNGIISFCAGIQICLFSFVHYSPVKMLIYFVAYTMVMKKILIPYELGCFKFSDMEETYNCEMDNLTRLKIVYDIYEEKDVNKYMKIYFIALAIDVALWIAFSINICNGII